MRDNLHRRVLLSRLERIGKVEAHNATQITAVLAATETHAARRVTLRLSDREVDELAVVHSDATVDFLLQRIEELRDGRSAVWVYDTYDLVSDVDER